MKELSIEQKAKAYDEAIEKAKDMLSYKEVRQEDIEYLFPELKESEDEKIKNQILYAIRQLPICKETKDKCVAWVEDKSVEWDKSDITTLGEIIMTLHTGVFMSSPDRKRQVEWLKRLTPRPKKEWGDEDNERIEQICEDLKCGLINFKTGRVVKGLHFEEIIESNIDWLKNLRWRNV